MPCARAKEPPCSLLQPRGWPGILINQHIVSTAEEQEQQDGRAWKAFLSHSLRGTGSRPFSFLFFKLVVSLAFAPSSPSIRPLNTRLVYAVHSYACICASASASASRFTTAPVTPPRTPPSTLSAALPGLLFTLSAALPNPAWTALPGSVSA